MGILSLISGIATMFSVGFESKEGDKKNATFRIQKVTISQPRGQIYKN